MADGRARGRLIRAAASAARNRETPFYVLDRAAAQRALSDWSSAARRLGISLHYPYKCNRQPAFVELAARAGLGAEVTTRADLRDALGRGLPGDRLVVQGPAKDAALIDRALAAGAWLVADGPEDARAILARTRALSREALYLLRVRPAAAAGAQGRFGMRGAELAAFVRELRRTGSEPPRGLAFHLGTGLSTLTPYRSAIAEVGELARGLRAVGIEVSVLDAGGGFAASGEARRDVAGRPRPEPPPTRTLLRELGVLTARALPGARLLLEPGRALAGDAYALVARVVRIRGSRVYVDASRASHGFFVPRGRHPMWTAPARSGPARRYEIAGPLPVDLDVLSSSVRLGPVREGDLLVIGAVGAYNLNAANAWAGPIPEVVEI